MIHRSLHGRTVRHRGNATAMTLISIPVLLGCAALVIDSGNLYNVRSELQRSADAAALAGAWELLDDSRISEGSGTWNGITTARQKAADYAAQNPVQGKAPQVDLNEGNAFDGDILIGYLSDPNNLNQSIDVSNDIYFNSIRVAVRRDDIRNGSINTFFANIFGISSVESRASATAVIRDGVTGFRIPQGQSVNCQLLPFTLKDTKWDELLVGTWSVGDKYSYDPETGTVTAGPDGILELNLYPGAGAEQLPPGNFGTVDIGAPNNSTSDIVRQILHGINAYDLSFFGGELQLGTVDNPLILNGDTGLSAAVKDPFEKIKGQPRIIPLFSTVSGPGNNAMYTIVGFAGIRPLHRNFSAFCAHVIRYQAAGRARAWG
ncbi:MAG: hypothetical protein GXY44_02575 [Phycisphaerales bacterium]|nr:hypothetical protein [Phycisphaerales bacterium]